MASLPMEPINISHGNRAKHKKKTAQWEDEAHRKRRGRKEKQSKNRKKHAEFQMEEHKETIDQVVERHRTDLRVGLTKAEATSRLERDGPNVLSPVKKKAEWLVFVEQFTSVFALLLWVGALLSFLAYGLDSNGVDNLYIGIVLVLVVVISGVFSYVQERKSSDAMKKFKNLLPAEALALRDGIWQPVQASTLVCGDVVRVQSGDKLPADLRLVKTKDMKVDNSSITGEAEPQERGTEKTHDNPLGTDHSCVPITLAETENVAFSGSLVPEGSGEGIVVRTGDRTVIGNIFRMVTTTDEEETPIRKEISRFIKLIAIVAITLGIVFFGLSFLITNGRFQISNLVFAIGIIVANVPEGLLPTVTVSLALAAKRMARKQVLVKNLECVETLGAVTTICSDKTGTLTQNRMTVVHGYMDRALFTVDTGNSGDVDKAKAAAASLGASPQLNTGVPSFASLQMVAALCNKADFVEEDIQKNVAVADRRTTSDASESALLKFLETITPVREYRRAYHEVYLLPFNSHLKFQISIRQMEGRDSHILLVKGAPERILPRCANVMHNGTVKRMKKKYLHGAQNACDTFGGVGERVLGFAMASLPFSEFPQEFKFTETAAKDEISFNFPMESLTFVGLLALMDPPRPTVPGAIQRLNEAGIRVVMVTGDHPVTAAAIAKSVGIIDSQKPADKVIDLGRVEEIPMLKHNMDDAVVVPGGRIGALQPGHWRWILAHKEIVFARTSPQQKFEIVGENQLAGEVVAVTGDGVNDSPALKKADVGIAMGISGSDVSRDAANLILLDDNFANVVHGVEEGRVMYDNLKKSIAYTLTSNFPQLMPFMLYIIFRIPLAFSTILILITDIGCDVFPSISLAYERAESAVMKRPPRSRKERLITWQMICYSYFEIGAILCLMGYIAYLVQYRADGTPLRLLWQNGFRWRESDYIIAGKTFIDRREAMLASQAAYYGTVIVGKCATLICCTTRQMSLFDHGVPYDHVCQLVDLPLDRNRITLYSLLMFPLLLILPIYVPPLQRIFQCRSVTYGVIVWAVTFVIIFCYEEARKYFIRKGGKHGLAHRLTYY